MADMYSIVKKQDEKIDDILKIAKENKDMLVGIDTRLASARLRRKWHYRLILLLRRFRLSCPVMWPPTNL